MKNITINPDALLGGIIYQDSEREIVSLKLQPQNDIPIHQDSRTMLLIALSGRVEVQTADSVSVVTPENMVLLSPNEQHQLKVLAENSHLLVVKQKNSL